MSLVPMELRHLKLDDECSNSKVRSENRLDELDVVVSDDDAAAAAVDDVAAVVAVVALVAVVVVAVVHVVADLPNVVVSEKKATREFLQAESDGSIRLVWNKLNTG